MNSYFSEMKPMLVSYLNNKSHIVFSKLCKQCKIESSEYLQKINKSKINFDDIENFRKCFYIKSLDEIMK